MHRLRHLGHHWTINLTSSPTRFHGGVQVCMPTSFTATPTNNHFNFVREAER